MNEDSHGHQETVKRSPDIVVIDHTHTVCVCGLMSGLSALKSVAAGVTLLLEFYYSLTQLLRHLS